MKRYGLSWLWILGFSGLAFGGEAGSSREAEWKKTVEGAKKEGQVTIYPGAGQSLLPIEAGVWSRSSAALRTKESLVPAWPHT